MATKKLTDKQISDNKTDSIMKTIAWRAGYYRANVNRFVEDYLQINYLKLFQKILLHMMFTHNSLIFVACRGLGKSYLIALFCVCKCILYPGTKVVVNYLPFIVNRHNNYKLLRSKIGKGLNANTEVTILIA